MQNSILFWCLTEKLSTHIIAHCMLNTHMQPRQPLRNADFDSDWSLVSNMFVFSALVLPCQPNLYWLFSERIFIPTYLIGSWLWSTEGWRYPGCIFSLLCNGRCKIWLIDAFKLRSGFNSWPLKLTKDVTVTHTHTGFIGIDLRSRARRPRRKIDKSLNHWKPSRHSTALLV